MKFKNYYDVLGVARDAKPDEIKRAYRKLARRYHPDVSAENNAEERFKEVSEAYEALRDPERRQAYDQLGSNWRAGDDFTPPPGWAANRGAYNFEFGGADFGEFFDQIFGREGPRQRQPDDRFRMRGSDQTVTVDISIEDSYFGREQVIELRGDGVPARQIKFSVPKGIVAGQRIRLAGQGMNGYGGESAGDLYLEVRFVDNQRFRVDRSDIHTLLPIAPWEAALGAKIAVPTLGGDVVMTIPAGVQSGQRLRLVGRGLPAKTGGDQLVEIQITMPPVDSEEKRALFVEMEKMMAYDPRAS